MIIPPQPALPAQPDRMEVDEGQPREPEVNTTIALIISSIPGILKVSKRCGRARGARGRSAAGQKKGKGSSVECGAKGSVQSNPPAPAEQSSGGSSSENDLTIEVCQCPLNWLGTNMRWQCKRCVNNTLKCVISAFGSCSYCNSKKLKCSLMPVNPETGKADHHAMTEANIHNFCLSQVKVMHKARHAAVKRGKRPVPESPNADDQGGSASAASPHAQLMDLERLLLGGGKPSPARSPADSLATLPRPLLEDAAPKPCKYSKPSPSKSTSTSPSAAPTQRSTGPTVEAPSALQFLNPAHLHASHSPSSVSPSNSTILRQAARIDMLEAKQRELEQRVGELEEKQRVANTNFWSIANRLHKAGL